MGIFCCNQLLNFESDDNNFENENVDKENDLNDDDKTSNFPEIPISSNKFLDSFDAEI